MAASLLVGAMVRRVIAIQNGGGCGDQALGRRVVGQVTLRVGGVQYIGCAMYRSQIPWQRAAESSPTTCPIPVDDNDNQPLSVGSGVSLQPAPGGPLTRLKP